MGSRFQPTFDRDFGDLGELTPDEVLLVDRRRRGETQERAAERYGLTRFQYGQVELGRRALPEDREPPRVTGLAAHEACMLYRRRSGKTIGEIAGELGKSKYWVNSMELGKVKCDLLVWYWERPDA